MATVFVRVMGAGAKATAEPTRAEARTIFIMMLVLLGGMVGYVESSLQRRVRDDVWLGT